MNRRKMIMSALAGLVSLPFVRKAKANVKRFKGGNSTSSSLCLDGISVMAFEECDLPWGNKIRKGCFVVSCDNGLVFEIWEPDNEEYMTHGRCRIDFSEFNDEEYKRFEECFALAEGFAFGKMELRGRRRPEYYKRELEKMDLV